MWFVSSSLARVKYARNIFTSRLSCTHVRDGCDRHLECSLPPSPISICPFTRKSRPEMGRADTTSDAESVARREREDNRILKLISDMRRSGRRESESVCIRKIRYALLRLRLERSDGRPTAADKRRCCRCESGAPPPPPRGRRITRGGREGEGDDGHEGGRPESLMPR